MNATVAITLEVVLVDASLTNSLVNYFAEQSQLAEAAWLAATFGGLNIRPLIVQQFWPLNYLVLSVGN